LQNQGERPVCDLNSATVAEIAEIPGVSLSQAYDLSLWRPYLDWEEVEMVPSFDHVSVAALRDAGAKLVVPGYATWARDTGRPDAPQS
jgi:DNA uptake protein ComE-like DNA-binding protein